MTEGRLIRAASADDLQAILGLQRKYPQVANWNEAIWVGLLRGDEIPLRRVWVSDGESTISGFVVLAVAGDVAEFEMVLVDQAMRGHGIGRALCETAILCAAQQGARQIELEVRESNAAARTLYASLGFEVQGMRPNYYRHPIENAVLMGVTL
jgi:ribosomal-protein-alanine N-acetyltransferase